MPDFCGASFERGPCGFFNDRECICSVPQISRYLAKISVPLLDRIDLQVKVAALTTDEIASVEPGESSAEIRARVDAARQIQHERFRRATIRCNVMWDVRVTPRRALGDGLGCQAE